MEVGTLNKVLFKIVGTQDYSFYVRNSQIDPGEKENFIDNGPMS